jgi:hypothetical protein
MEDPDSDREERGARRANRDPNRDRRDVFAEIRYCGVATPAVAENAGRNDLHGLSTRR